MCQQHNSISTRSSAPALAAKLARESSQDDAKLRVQLDEERVAAHDLSEALGAHDVAADARVPVGIDLLGAEEARHVGEAEAGRRERHASSSGRRLGGGQARAERQRRVQRRRSRADGGAGPASGRGGRSLAVEHGVGEGDNARRDGLERLGDGHHRVADLPGVAAAQRQQCVGAAPAPRARVRQPEHVRDCVACYRVAEVEWP